MIRVGLAIILAAFSANAGAIISPGTPYDPTAQVQALVQPLLSGVVRTVAGNGPDANGAVILPTTFTGISMSNTSFSGITTLNGNTIATLADIPPPYTDVQAAAAAAPGIASEASARNAAIAAAASPLATAAALAAEASTRAANDNTNANALTAEITARTNAVAATLADVIQVSAPAAGSTVIANAGTTVLFINNTGLLTSLTVTMPANPVDGQRFTVCAGGTITTIGFTGGVVKGALTTMAVNGYARFIYSATLGAWFRAG